MIKITTIKNKVDQLLKLKPKDIDFQGVDHGKTLAHDTVEQIHKDLRNYNRELTEAENGYARSKVNNALHAKYSQLVDLFDGDAHRAMNIYNTLVNSYIAQHKQLDETKNQENATNLESNNEPELHEDNK